jgi:hypothetical protein
VSATANHAAKRALGCLRRGHKELYEADRATLEGLRPWLDQLGTSELLEALEELARVACFLDLSKKSPGAAHALLDLAARVAKAQPSPQKAAR